jgi:hypothetical protein
LGRNSFLVSGIGNFPTPFQGVRKLIKSETQGVARGWYTPALSAPGRRFVGLRWAAAVHIDILQTLDLIETMGNALRELFIQDSIG